jgi:hypothetical protein
VRRGPSWRDTFLSLHPCKEVAVKTVRIGSLAGHKVVRIVACQS